ncbi:MAG: alkaline phosphatase D family protein [Bacteroidota bacterium]
MKKIFIDFLFAGLCSISLISGMYAQTENSPRNNSRVDEKSSPFNEMLAPFYHGVASGDPLTDGVIIWTRVTPDMDQTIQVDWEMATDTGFVNTITSGSVMTDISKDYTVKVDVPGLIAGTTYYYRFNALGTQSIIGRTKTLPVGSPDQLKFGVVSCNNYQSGYFSAFERLSELNDLDAIIHLGDFIYEYESGGYGYDEDIGRGHEPANEILNLSDYRMRYSYYRLEDELRRVMQQHPFILIWDDHEVANNAWVDGAGNHDPLTEGLYADRKNAATQAYFEWAPIRDNTDNQVFRTSSYGDLVELVLLDTRHEARVEQVNSAMDPTINDPSRVLLGDEQMVWFKDRLSNSNATWKIIGNQVLFAPLILQPFEAILPGASNLFLDTWDGYPAKRTEVINYIDQNNIDDVFFITGDIHVSMSFDITLTPDDTMTYNPVTGMGSVAVEAVTPSISSPNFDELFGSIGSSLMENLFPGVDPHAKYVEFDEHGYFILDVTPSKAQADYYFVPTIVSPTQIINYECSLFSNSGENYLQKTNVPSPPKPFQDIPAPDPTLLITSVQQPANEVLVISVYPNPTASNIHINYALAQAGKMEISIIAVNGQLVKNVFSGNQFQGNYGFDIDVNDLSQGVYFIELRTDKGVTARQFIKK